MIGDLLTGSGSMYSVEVMNFSVVVVVNFSVVLVVVVVVGGCFFFLNISIIKN